MSSNKEAYEWNVDPTMYDSHLIIWDIKARDNAHWKEWGEVILGRLINFFIEGQIGVSDL